MQVFPLTGIGEVRRGDDVAGLLVEAMAGAGIEAADGDVAVVTHKIVSKAEGAVAALPESDDAAYRALVEQEAAAVIRRRGDLVIAVTSHGFICANAGVDRSNVPGGSAVLLPRDPDRSAHSIRLKLERATGVRWGVVISDTFGRPWRRGLTDVALGVSGIPAVLDLRGSRDMQGRTLDVTEVAVADEIAAAADLVMGKAAGIPAAVVRGLAFDAPEGRGADLVREPDEDLFR